MKKLISLVLVLMLALSLVPAAVAEAKEPVHLVTISAGSKPAGYDAVMDLPMPTPLRSTASPSKSASWTGIPRPPIPSS